MHPTGRVSDEDATDQETLEQKSTVQETLEQNSTVWALVTNLGEYRGSSSRADRYTVKHGPCQAVLAFDQQVIKGREADTGKGLVPTRSIPEQIQELYKQLECAPDQRSDLGKQSRTAFEKIHQATKEAEDVFKTATVFSDLRDEVT
ncbi:hypothetical protein BGZ83_003563 [Gryganskiella cystojenkinii]|nr:hypothetical protein BGZ83_003563 [Gryganskiella cystojenkinii]